MTLLLHAGANPVEYDALRELTTPPATATHVPIPHHRIVDLAVHSLSFYGHEVIEQHHGVTEDGMRYFGLLSLKSAYGDYTDTVGLRNSHDKRFPIGIAFGSRVFVCDNMAFSASQVVIRRHTANAKRDLPGLIGQLVEPLADQREAQARTIGRYKHALLTNHAADHVIMQLYRDDVINLQRIPEVLAAYEDPPCDWGDYPSAWRMFNAATYALNGRVAENPETTQRLHRVIDGVCQTLN